MRFAIYIYCVRFKTLVILSINVNQHFPFGDADFFAYLCNS